MDEVTTTTEHAQHILAGRLRRYHEVVEEHSTAWRALVRVAKEPHFWAASYSPRCRLVTADPPRVLALGRTRARRYGLPVNQVVEHINSRRHDHRQ